MTKRCSVCRRELHAGQYLLVHGGPKVVCRANDDCLRRSLTAQAADGTAIPGCETCGYLRDRGLMTELLDHVDKFHPQGQGVPA